MSQLNDNYDIIPLIWEGDGHTSPNYSTRYNWYSVQALPTAVFGGEVPEVGGGDTYPRYVNHYNTVSAIQSPLEIDVSFETSIGGSVVLSADVEVTNTVTTDDNFVQLILTYNYSASYFCTVVRYEEETFNLTDVGQTAQFSRSFTIDDDWDLAKLTGVVIVQTNEGSMTGGQYPIHTRAVLQAGKAFLPQDAVLTGMVTDAFTNNPIAGATITAGSFETTTTFNGTYTLNTIPTTYDVVCSSPNYEPTTENITTISDEIINLDLTLSEMLLPPYVVYAEVDGGSVSLTWPYPEIPTASFVVEIRTDDYPAETSWGVTDHSGNQIAGINAGDLSNASTVYTWEMELDMGSYTFTIYDSYGDGICCNYGQGYYSLVLNGTEIANGGNFGSSESVNFNTEDARTRDVLGYNIWEGDNEEPINGEDIVTELTFTVEGLMNGVYSFAVSAVYASGESPQSTPVEVEVTDASIVLEIQNMADWNMVGLPVMISDPSYQNVYSNAVENTLYSFGEGYQSETELVPGNGYWLRFAQEGANTIIGGAIHEVTVPLTQDWNMISGPSFYCDVDGIIDPDDLIVPGTFYGFGNGYESTSILEPGKGYWVRSYGAGEVLVVPSYARKTEQPINWLEHAHVLTINGKNLYFGVDIPERDMLRYSLPPKPPLGAFDVRFTGDWLVAESSSAIDIMNTDEKTTVSWHMSTTKEIQDQWVLVNPVTGEELILMENNQIVLNGNLERLHLEKRVVSSPEIFSLRQNYPNPFNPVTTIEYTIAKEGRVTLVVYDLLGKEIQSLVNAIQTPGNYSVKFDGETLSSGVYFYTMTTDENTFTKKLILLK